VKTSTLELPAETRSSPNAKPAVKVAMRPRTKPFDSTMARMAIAGVGRRHAVTVVIMIVMRMITAREYILSIERRPAVIFVALGDKELRGGLTFDGELPFSSSTLRLTGCNLRQSPKGYIKRGNR
jgi:hypothetical protein